MSTSRIAITAIASFSPLGYREEDVWQNYLKPVSLIKEIDGVPLGSIPNDLEKPISDLRLSDSRYRFLDKSVLYAILASRVAIEKSGWRKGEIFGINMGSSRGATELFEKHHLEFLKNGKTSALCSPSTTLGNISSWVAQDLKCKGPEISHSITCSTSLHSLLNGIAWLQSGMSDRFLVGGSEAPLTPFTIAQMKALKIYATGKSSCYSNFICKSLDFEKTENTLVLGEGATAVCLEKNVRKRALAYIEGVGFATEIIEHGASISEEAECFQRSMKMALKNTPLNEVDCIVMHAPGTIKGDLSEYKAIEKVFKGNPPPVTGNKWKIGHSFGASGGLSLELAVLMLKHQKFIPVPFHKKNDSPEKLRKILLNAVGFGGNAVSVLISN